ncbi:MAG: RNA polymerase sigma factor RpoD/SigA [Treponema sp.]|nr:RNA polymerase sigma factor RpoD/SigA [Treponema sp.]
MERTNKTKSGRTCLEVYYNQIKDFPILSGAEEAELSQRIQSGDDAARRRLIESNLRLVVKIARPYASDAVLLMDVIQDGNIGLIRAVEKFDHRKGVRFSTYATFWIRHAIVRGLEEKRRPIRLPRHKEDVLRKIQRSNHALRQLYMRDPKPAEIATAIGTSCSDVENLLGLTEVFAPVDDTGDYTYNPESAVMKKSSQEAVQQVLENLSDREKNIIMYRYQLNGGKRDSLKKIGDKMGISTETVRQTEFRALRKMRGEAENLRCYFEAM